jgi:hypothetical protein
MEFAGGSGMLIRHEDVSVVGNSTIFKNLCRKIGLNNRVFDTKYSYSCRKGENKIVV